MATSQNPYDPPAAAEHVAVAASDPGAADSTAGLWKDRVFGGLLVTQFLGAFNDNYFKQMVLLKCVALSQAGGSNLQALALAAFALPFVFLSGFAGFLSDRLSKRTMIVWCKVGEIVVMVASLLALLAGDTPKQQVQLLILVLALMAAQSAFFGPSKYGILPELFSGRRLLPVNGAIQMTTFLAIIFGTALAGFALDRLGDALWMFSAVAIGIAVVGTLTALLISPTPVAKPDLKFATGNLFVPGDVRRYVLGNRPLLMALLVMTTFWFVGGVAQPAVNNLGKLTWGLNDTRVSLLAANIGVGIAFGCVISGIASSRSAGGGATWTVRGSWMVVASLLFIAVTGSGLFGQPQLGLVPAESLLHSLTVADRPEWLMRIGMLLLGLSAGVFVIPVQVLIQQSPPADYKGRLIGTMNLMTWIGILASAGFIGSMDSVLAVFAGADADRHHYVTFFLLACLMLPVALFYRLPNSVAADDQGKD